MFVLSLKNYKKKETLSVVSTKTVCFYSNAADLRVAKQ